MQHLWSMGEGLVKDIRDCFDEPRPVRNTISTVIRILEKKDFVAHKTLWERACLLSVSLKK